MKRLAISARMTSLTGQRCGVVAPEAGIEYQLLADETAVALVEKTDAKHGVQPRFRWARSDAATSMPGVLLQRPVQL